MSSVSAKSGGLLVLALAAGCDKTDPDRLAALSEHPEQLKSAAAVRAGRRAFDGAPPVIPHEPFGADCTSCHTPRGLAVPGIGFAPPSPHEMTAGMSAISRCRQCHVFKTTDALFVENDFDGLRQDLRRGKRLNEFAPPVVPHQILMRENCTACHTGPAAREEIRCTHPDRANCRQCHVSTTIQVEFARPGAVAAAD